LWFGRQTLTGVAAMLGYRRNRRPHHPRRAASILATSIFLMSTIAAKSRLASAVQGPFLSPLNLALVDLAQLPAFVPGIN